MTLRDMLRLFLACVLLGNAGWVLAAQEVLTPDQVPLVQYLYTIVLATWGGMAATLQRWSKGTEAGQWWLILWRDVTCSTLSGILAFFATKHWGIPPMLAAIIISTAGYGGSLFLDAVLARVVKGVDAANLNSPGDKKP